MLSFSGWLVLKVGLQLVESKTVYTSTTSTHVLINRFLCFISFLFYFHPIEWRPIVDPSKGARDVPKKELGSIHGQSEGRVDYAAASTVSRSAEGVAHAGTGFAEDPISQGHSRL